MNQPEPIHHEHLQQNRIRSFDILRGFSIILMLIAHVGTYWLNVDSQWLVALYFLVVNVEGTNGFTFTAGLGFGYSWAHDRDLLLPYSKITQRIVRRTGFLLILSIGYNLFAVLARGDGLWFEYFWYWGILQCISICRLCGILFIRLDNRIRFGTALFIIFAAAQIAKWLLPDPTGTLLKAVIYYLFFNPMYANGLLFFLPFFLGGTIIGEWCYNLKKMSVGSDTKGIVHITDLWKKKPSTYFWFMLGIITISVGIMIGWKGVSWDFGWNLLSRINTHPRLDWVKLPLFLVANSYAWVLYSLGIEILVAIGLILVIDYFQRGRIFYLTTRFGKYSLTVYLGQYIFLFWPILVNQFDSRSIWFPLAGFLLLWAGLLYLIDHRTHGFGSIEFLLRNLERIKPKQKKE